MLACAGFVDGLTWRVMTSETPQLMPTMNGTSARTESATSSTVLRRFCAMRVYTSTGWPMAIGGVILCRVEADFHILSGRLFGIEKIHRKKAKPTGEHVAGEGLDAGVVIERVLIVELARVGDFFFGVREVALELLKRTRGLELRVVFRHHHQASQRRSQRLVGGCHRGRAGGFGQATARLGNLGENRVLVRGVTANRLHQVGNQARTAFQLYVDSGPRLARAVARQHQAVIQENRPQRRRNRTREAW